MAHARTRLALLGGLELRTRSVFEVVDTSFRVYRKHFLFLLALAAIPNMLGAPVFLALSESWTARLETPDEGFLGSFLPVFLGGIAASWLTGIQLVLTLVLGAAGMRDVSMGREPGVGRALRATLARWPAVTAAVLGHATILSVLTCLFCGLPALSAVYGALFCLFPYAMFFEGRGLIDSLVRSWRLVAQHFFHVLLVLFITAGVFETVLESALTLPVVLIDLMRHGLAGGQSESSVALLGAGRGVAQTLCWPLVTASLCLVYFDLLMRREGLDLRLRCPTADRPSGTPVSSALPLEVRT